MDIQALSGTDFQFPGQTGVYHGKVRDVYTIGDNNNLGYERLVIVVTDRISAFDNILPRAIPYKGQVLNELADYFLGMIHETDIIPCQQIAIIDPNTTVAVKAEPFKLEMVVRGYLVGHAWREYKAGKRKLCGVALPDGLKEYDRLPEPIITPATKATEGHDEDISKDEIIKRGLATPDEWEQLSDYTYKLFEHGQTLAEKRGLILADTKYEFGKVDDGIIILIDEVHTPDSSRYFYADSLKAGSPKHLSKEFVREWLMEKGFSGQPGQAVPEMSDEFVEQISQRYIELFETLTGTEFVKADSTDIKGRIEQNVINYLEEHP